MVLLVRFGELALKSPYVRRQLRDKLVENIQEMFAAGRIECLIRADRARIYIDVNDVPSATAALRRVFGMVSFSDAVEATSDPEDIGKRTVELARRALPKGGSFAVRARRAGTHAYTSQDLARLVGQKIRDAIPEASVDLDEPNAEIHVEVRENRSFVFTEIVDGPGGLPMGSQGRVLAVVNSDAGAVAAWLAMKRGCKVSVASQDDSTAVEPLFRWDVRLKVLPWEPKANLQELVRLSRSEAVVLGSRPEDVPREKPALDVPVFYPVIGFDDTQIRALVERIRSA